MPKSKNNFAETNEMLDENLNYFYSVSTFASLKKVYYPRWEFYPQYDLYFWHVSLLREGFDVNKHISWNKKYDEALKISFHL